MEPPAHPFLAVVEVGLTLRDLVRVVDGNVITSPGGLASYEASLYVVEQLFGKEQALSIAAALVFGPSNIATAITTK